MGDQNNLYKLSGIIEFDDAFIGGKRAGKRGRGAVGECRLPAGKIASHPWLAIAPAPAT